MDDDFARFEHESWQRVADKYDSVWSPLTRQFIPYLLTDAKVAPGMSVLDVACGPAYVSAAVKQLGAVPTGMDFSEKMISIAKTMLPEISFTQGDAQELPFEDGSFDRVLMNFGLLHVSHPEQACAEACRVLKAGGHFGFTVWAGPEQNPGAKIVNDAIEAHALWMSACRRARRNICTANERNADRYWNDRVLTAARCRTRRAPLNGIYRMPVTISKRNETPASARPDSWRTKDQKH
jgi:ubiquinone/menaquinone biosynthesis C-methylase UbiE